MARRMRPLDWSPASWSPPEGWPENLRVAVRLSLTSRFPILLWWGPRLALLYNDAYLTWLTEAKHPRALGRPGDECWSEIRDVIGPMIAGVLFDRPSHVVGGYGVVLRPEGPQGGGLHHLDLLAPILAADGRTVDGIFNPCVETTEKVIGARCLETLRKLGIRPARRARSTPPVRRQWRCLRRTRDIPFAAIYVAREGGDRATPCATMLPPGDHLLPVSVSTSEDDSRSPWPLASALRTETSGGLCRFGLCGSTSSVRRGRRKSTMPSPSRSTRLKTSSLASSSSASVPAAHSMRTIARSSSWSLVRSPPPSPTPGPTRRRRSGPRPSPSSTGRRRPSSPTSRTSSARR